MARRKTTPDVATRRPVGTTTLFFKPEAALAHVDDPLHLDISAVAVAGRTVFAACDETATVERLVLDHDGDFQHEENIALGDYFDLPDGPTGEMDIEGLAVDGDDLWITGSHSLKRDKPDLPAADHEAAMATLAQIERDPNRCFLGRLKLTDAGEGRFVVDAAAIAKGDEAAPSAIKMGSKGRGASSRSCSSGTRTWPPPWACRARRTASTSRASRSSAIGCSSGSGDRCCAAGR